MASKIHSDAIGIAALILVVAAWIFFGAIFLLRKRSAKAEESKRDSSATLGIVLQSLSFVLVSNFRRAYWWPFSPSVAGEVALAALTVLLAWLSAWFCLRAVQTLGKQWTFAARVISGHELITVGRYSVVRNPIYLGMFGLMLATGLVLATWWALAAALVIYLVGNMIRIRAEEQLLAEAFGDEFHEYARRGSRFPAADLLRPGQGRQRVYEILLRKKCSAKVEELADAPDLGFDFAGRCKGRSNCGQKP